MASSDDPTRPRLSPRPTGAPPLYSPLGGALLGTLALVPGCPSPTPPPSDTGVDAFIAPMPPPMDAGGDAPAIAVDAGTDAIIAPMPPPSDAGVDDAPPIPPMPPPPEDVGVIAPMPPPMPGPK